MSESSNNIRRRLNAFLESESSVIRADRNVIRSLDAADQLAKSLALRIESNPSRAMAVNLCIENVEELLY